MVTISILCDGVLSFKVNPVGDGEAYPSDSER